jgi:hypothetical protein
MQVNEYLKIEMKPPQDPFLQVEICIIKGRYFYNGYRKEEVEDWAAGFTYLSSVIS